MSAAALRSLTDRGTASRALTEAGYMPLSEYLASQIPTGEDLKAWRLARAMTQLEAATLAGVTKGSWYLWERCGASPVPRNASRFLQMQLQEAGL